VTVEDVENSLCGPAANWIAEDGDDTAVEAERMMEGRRLLVGMVHEIMGTKKEDERRRQRIGRRS